MTTARRTTAADIAVETGLSRATVSCVLSGQGDRVRVRPETQQRIWEAARTLGYRPDTAARAMRTGKFGTVALIQSTSPVAYLPYRMIEGIVTELERSGVHLSLTNATSDSLTDEEFLPKVVREMTADGLLVNRPVDIPLSLLKTIAEFRIPSIWLNDRRESDCVFPDDAAAGKQATQYLLSLGHSRIAFVTATGLPEANTGKTPAAAAGQHYSVLDRMAGYQAALAEAGSKHAAQFVSLKNHPVEDNLPERIVLARQLLGDTPSRPTAVVCYDPQTGMALLVAALSLGLRVPEDLSLITVDGRGWSEYGYALTSCAANMHTVGQCAAQSLTEKIVHPDSPVAPVAVPPSLTIGVSCAPFSRL